MFRFVISASALAWVRSVVTSVVTTGPLTALFALMFSVTSCFGGGFTPLPTHGLALLPNGQLAGWGANEFAQVQAGQRDFLKAPLHLNLPGAKPVMVAAGSRHSLAVDNSGRVWGWGDNSSGQLGLGHTRPASAMSLITALPARAVAVAAGTQHSAALLADGSVWVWGANNRGQLGTGAVEAFAIQVKPLRVAKLGKVIDITAGSNFVLALVSQHDKGGVLKNMVWAWGAGNGVPHLVDGIQNAVLLRAAGDVAMARTATGSYWQWRAETTPPEIAQRTAFERLGQMTHPMLATLTPLVSLSAADIQARPALVSANNSVATPGQTMAAASATATAAAPVPTFSLAPVSAPVTPAAPAVAAVLPTPAASVPASPLARVNLSGTVRLSAGFGGDSSNTAGKPLENVQVVAEGAQCSLSDNQGRYVCNVLAGWSGRVSLRRTNYRFSPSALSFQNLRIDAGQQDFAAIYDPR